MRLGDALAGYRSIIVFEHEVRVIFIGVSAESRLTHSSWQVYQVDQQQQQASAKEAHGEEFD